MIFFGESLSHLAARVQSIWPSFKQRLLQGFHVTILRHIHFQETWCNWLNLDTRHCKVDDSVFLLGKALKGGDPQMWFLHRCMINNAKKTYCIIKSNHMMLRYGANWHGHERKLGMKWYDRNGIQMYSALNDPLYCLYYNTYYFDSSMRW